MRCEEGGAVGEKRRVSLIPRERREGGPRESVERAHLGLPVPARTSNNRDTLLHDRDELRGREERSKTR